MPNPIGPYEFNPLLGTPGLKTPTPSAEVGSSDGPRFKDVLLDHLSEVNRLQMEANQGMEKLATGQTDNYTEVFSAVRKADVAFSMLMEIRNKLVDAYRELQQMRV